ncbi:MAG: hypothetical protein NZ700_00365, partial [Gemmataceae bacterium]|nr:hypothetical protein [Gemmataceae bacterium]MDW8265867.1 hypothetical protein [Gemmataceae bacterium]
RCRLAAPATFRSRHLLGYPRRDTMSARSSAEQTAHRARREAVLVLFIWATAFAWTLSWCYLRGYTHPPDSWLVRVGWAEPVPEHRTIAGLPHWVFVGILVPWLACLAITLVFGLFLIRDDDLGREGGEGEHGGP